MFGSTYSALENIIKGGSTYSQRGDANATYKMITSFKLIFIFIFDDGNHKYYQSSLSTFVAKISGHLECYAVSF
jgi:hypothetical protein